MQYLKYGVINNSCSAVHVQNSCNQKITIEYIKLSPAAHHHQWVAQKGPHDVVELMVIVVNSGLREGTRHTTPIKPDKFTDSKSPGDG